MIKQLVEFAVKQLVAEPEHVNIQVFHDGPKGIIEIRVAPEDIKRVIGKEGHIIKSIRAMVDVLAPANKELKVDIIKE
jgi:uncharacterized protein